jgi:NAD(P)-dependent dehydrogenase (short-subunit alcohol dehydrogenase family)
MVAQVTQRLGAIDILVNNAGIIQVGPYATLTLQDFEQAQATIFWGAVYTTLAVVPQMQARGAGRIVNITSLGGRVSIPHLLPYTSAKFALVGFSEGLTAELAPYGIRVTTVVPGLMRTGSYLQAFFKGQRAQEFSWFSPVASWPFFSIGVEQAARQIVEATRRGAAQCTLTIPAHLLSWLHGLLPGPTVQMFALANRLMPQATESAAAPQRGMEVRADLPTGVRRVVDAVTPLGRQAAARYQHVEVG